ncbi:MAG: metal-dependent transcriptional regulator, partial [Thermodesulfobacteriota bacterium]|nr:metal-dependent transcriptional regulator [Thermodesulfobacteriota bacterium]
MEDYLELIFKLGEEKKVVRVRDIARGMQVKMPSVTSMLNVLVKKSLINHDKYEYVELTPKGIEIAKEISRTHEILFNFLKNVLQVDSETAEKDACKMEHSMSEVTLNRLIDFVKFVEVCPRLGFDWLEYFPRYMEGECSKDKCIEYMQNFLNKHSEKVNQKSK